MASQETPHDVVKQLQPSVIQHLENVYSRYAGPDGYWSREQIQQFMRTTQQHSGPLPQWIEEKHTLDFSHFLKYMASPDANVMARYRIEDLSRPLTSYFIKSSHNTYLEGNQLSSKSSANAYTKALKRGCRCVEVDVWDAKEGDLSTDEDTSDSEADDVSKEKPKKSRFSMSALKSKLRKLADTDLEEEQAKTKKKAKKAAKKAKVKQMIEERFPAPPGVVEPKVYHGYTITKPVSFRRVCIAILDDAFTATDTPLIVSLEVHCGPEQQEQMVKIMNQVFDGYLLDQPEITTTNLPAPESLKRKILIKVKYAPHVSGGEEQAAEDGQTDDEEVAPAGDIKKAKPSKIIHSLSDMGVYTRGITFKDFNNADARMPTHIFSLSEKKVLDVDPHELFEHNRKYLMRTYPAGTRVMSSNFDPIPRWNKGIQVVALNWQGWDEAMMLNEGMFAGTGGWMLKPQGFLLGDISPPEAKTLDLSIIVMAAQNLPLPEEDDKIKDFEPYVKCEIHYEQPHGHTVVSSSAEREDEYKLRTRERSGVHPNFSAQCLEFKNVPGINEALSFVRFTVRDDELGKDDMSAWACVRLDRIQQGYRFVHLFDTLGQMTDAVILVKILKRLK